MDLILKEGKATADDDDGHAAKHFTLRSGTKGALLWWLNLARTTVRDAKTFIFGIWKTRRGP